MGKDGQARGGELTGWKEVARINIVCLMLILVEEEEEEAM